MAREKKPIELRPVEETPVAEADIVRLGGDPTVLRVIPERADLRPPPDARLELPDLESAEPLRTHEPGVESLLEAELASMTTDEVHWGKEARERPPFPWGWFVLLGLVLAGAIGWSLNYVIQAGRDLKQGQQSAFQSLVGTEAVDRDIVRSLAIMEATVRKFCEARSIDEMLPVVRHPERIRPLMEKYYAETPLRPLGFVRRKDFQGATFGTITSFWVYKVVVGDGRTKVLLVEQVSNEVYRVDWETAVTYQPMAWDRYTAERPAGTTLDFRVQVHEDHFFSHEFADEHRWSSYRLTTPTGADTLFGYVPKGSLVEAVLRESLKATPGKPGNLILRLRLPEGLLSRRGVVIEKVLSARWIFVVPPEP
jgi:hypothetical protein